MPFLSRSLLDLGATERLFKHLKAAMPRVTPHYAVKCFPEPAVMATLAACGAGFDCASSGELEQVLSLGVSADRVIFANPCKRFCDLAAIKKHKVPHTTFDSLGELRKLAARAPGTGAVLRLRADDPSARMPFGVKYGALPGEVPELLAEALALGVRIAGTSFHVGSGAGDPAAYKRALAACRACWDLLTELDPKAREKPWVVDVGGGFSGGFQADKDGAAYVAVGGGDADAVASAVNAALDELFPDAAFPGGLALISEPGRYFAESSAHVVTRVFGKRERAVHPGPANESKEEEGGDAGSVVSSLSSSASLSDDESSDDGEMHEEEAVMLEEEVHYYISDGIYGGFNGIVYDGWLPKAIPFRCDGGTAGVEEGEE